MAKPDPTAAKRQQDLEERNAKRGLKKCRVWIPEDKRDELMAIVAQWRAEAKLSD